MTVEAIDDPNCRWSNDDPDACPYCTGEDCRLCRWSHEAMRVCDHAVDERHRDSP